MEPTPFREPEQLQAQGSWLSRAFTAVALERRLPYRVGLVVDRLLTSVGRPRKVLRANGLSVEVRRLSCDVSFVQNIIVNAEYTPAGFEIGRGDTVVDVGGNIGTFALVAARSAVDGRVVTIEPDNENYKLLRANIARNRLTNVTAIRAAVAARSGTIELFKAAEGGFHTMQADRAQDPNLREVVPAVRLQDVLDGHQIDRCQFLKLDCEGAEHEILHNLPAPYFARIDRIAMEYHGPADPQVRRAQADRLVDLLLAHGFRIDAYLEFVGLRGGMIRAMR